MTIAFPFVQSALERIRPQLVERSLANRKTDRRTDGRTDGQTDRQIHTHIHTHAREKSSGEIMSIIEV